MKGVCSREIVSYDPDIICRGHAIRYEKYLPTKKICTFITDFKVGKNSGIFLREYFVP